MTPAKTAAATANTNVPVANMNPTIRAIPRISRSKPSIAPVGERSGRRDELNCSASKARTLRDRSTDVLHPEPGSASTAPALTPVVLSKANLDRSISPRNPDAISQLRALRASPNAPSARRPARLMTQHPLSAGWTTSGFPGPAKNASIDLTMAAAAFVRQSGEVRDWTS